MINHDSNHDALFKYADVSTIITPVWKEVDYSDQLVSQVLDWTNTHVKNKLIKANKSLHILRKLRKEGYNQSEVDPLFNIIVLPNINYALSVYAASESDLTPVQCFLDRCFKRKYTSKPVGVYDFLERQDHKIFRKVSNAKGHPLLSIMPRVKPSSYNLRKETCFKSTINTMRFKNSFINRLVFN